WGFLPVMGEDSISNQVGLADFTRNGIDDPSMESFGAALVEAVRGAPGRGGTFCIELEANFGSMTTDLIPNEVCNFGQGDFNNFGANHVDANIDIQQSDVHAFSLMRD